MAASKSPTENKKFPKQCKARHLEHLLPVGALATPAETFGNGIRKTVQWYLDHPQWVQNVQSGAYKDWVNKQYTT